MEIGEKDLDKVNPDWRFSYFHAKSLRPGTCNDETPELCQCCLNIIHKQPIPLCVHAKQLQFLGFGFPLWYTFLKYCAILVLMLIVSQSFVSVYKAIQQNGQFCSDQYTKYQKYSPITIGIVHRKTHQLEAGSLQNLKQKDYFLSTQNPVIKARHFRHLSQVQENSHENSHVSEAAHENPQSFQVKNTEAHVGGHSNSNPQVEGHGDGQVENHGEGHGQNSGEGHGEGHGDSHSDGHEDGHGDDNGEEHGEDHGEGGHGDAHGPHCTGIFILLARISNEFDQLQGILRVSTFIVIMLTLIYIRDTLFKTQQYYDERRCSLSDFSVIFSKLPQTVGIQKAIRKFFYEEFSSPVEVEQMILIPEYEELEEIQEQKSHQLKILQKLLKQQKTENAHQIEEIERKVAELELKEKQEIEIFKKQIKSDKLISQRAIVVLSSQPEKERALDEFFQFDGENLKKYFGQQGASVILEEAPDPRQIIWENINYPSGKRVFRVFLGWALSVIFVAFVTFIFYFILRWKTHMVESQKSIKGATIIVITALILVILFNKFVMGTFLHHFTDLEKHATSDRFQFSFAFKYSLGMFFTTALMTLFVEALTFNNFYSHDYGVIEEESIMFFMNSLLVPLIWLINPFHLHKLIKRRLNFGNKYLTQRQANQIMEDFPYDMGKRYAEILETIWFTFLYVSLIPMGSFLTLIGIGLYYWADKYNLLRRSSVHENVSGKLALIAMKLLDAVLILMPLGQLIFDYFLKGSYKLTSLVLLFAGIAYMCLPINAIIDVINQENFNLQEKTYQQTKQTFKDNYFSLHPIYSKTHSLMNEQAKRKFKEEMIKNNTDPVFSFAKGWLLNNSNQKNMLQTKESQ